MKNLLLSLLMVFFISVTYNVQAQEAILDGEVVAVQQDNVQPTQPVAEQTVYQKIMSALGLDIWGLITFALTIVSAVAGTFWYKAKRKLRQAGELLISVAEAYEDDNRADAEERKIISKKARDLFSKI